MLDRAFNLFDADFCTLHLFLPHCMSQTLVYCTGVCSMFQTAWYQRYLKYHVISLKTKICPFYWYKSFCIFSNFALFYDHLYIKGKYSHFDLSLSAAFFIFFKFWGYFLKPFFMKGMSYCSSVFLFGILIMLWHHIAELYYAFVSFSFLSLKHVVACFVLPLCMDLYYGVALSCIGSWNFSFVQYINGCFWVEVYRVYLLLSNCVSFVLRVHSQGQALSLFKTYRQKFVAGWSTKG
jgi:hypothetical protein